MVTTPAPHVSRTSQAGPAAHDHRDAGESGEPGPARCAVLGSPIAHSLSPVLHRAAYVHLGLAWTYDAIDITEATLPAFLAGLDGSWRGLSLTMPLKRAVMPMLDDADDWARISGAANTVLIDGARRIGANTDIPGAIAAITERHHDRLRHVRVLGGGATAASCLIAAADLGASTAEVLVRAPARAQETLDVLSVAAPRMRIEVGQLAAPLPASQVDLLISTVPATAHTEDLTAHVGAAAAVFDVVYDPWPTPVMSAARAAGRPLITGLDLLVHQAVLQVGLMTGRAGPIDEMRAAGEQALRARTQES